MSIESGRRNKKIVIERAGAPVDDGYTKVPGPWTALCAPHADVFYGSGTEQRQAAQEGASQTASFDVLANSNTRSVSVADRISFDGGYWDITSNVEIERGAGRRITGVRRAA
ncbi:head-tail adaptor protein [Sphingobium sp.]|uniref:head-tail adaptor protein n=1 Tax=Sphingobium sp. TaxID=1912891 RepID=UPI003BB4D7A6